MPTVAKRQSAYPPHPSKESSFRNIYYSM